MSYFTFCISCLFVICIAILLRFKLPTNVDRINSSVFCYKDLRGNNMCHFRNIAYVLSTDSFVFLLGNTSTFIGISNISSMQNLKLSSVTEHNAFNFNIAPMTNHKINCDKSYRKSILIARFKQDNVMHVLHDDLLPLYNLMLRLCDGNLYNCDKDLNIVFYDNTVKGPHWFLYKLINENLVLLRNEQYGTVCFENAYVGLDTEVVWYQYGFNKPRGPMLSSDYNIDHVIHFKKFVLSKLNIEPYNNPHAVILSRNNSRRLLNVDSIKRSVEKHYNKKVFVKQVSQLTIKDVIRSLVNAELIIGVHGAELILTLFSKPSVKVIEIFPYGVTPVSVSYLKPLSLVVGSPFQYFSWMNTDRNNSKPPQKSIVDYTPSIKETEPFTQVYCCDDPKFLWYMYQDTFVSDDFHEVVGRAVASKTVEPQNRWFFPAPVVGLSCNITGTSLRISWSPPFNVNNTEVEYAVTVNIDTDIKSFISCENLLVLNGQVKRAAVWVSARAKINLNSGPDSYLQCDKC